MFNVACYHSVFESEMKEYATKLFNHSMACRLGSGLAIENPSYKLHYKIV